MTIEFKGFKTRLIQPERETTTGNLHRFRRDAEGNRVAIQPVDRSTHVGFGASAGDLSSVVGVYSLGRERSAGVGYRSHVSDDAAGVGYNIQILAARGAGVGSLLNISGVESSGVGYNTGISGKRSNSVGANNIIKHDDCNVLGNSVTTAGDFETWIGPNCVITNNPTANVTTVDTKFGALDFETSQDVRMRLVDSDSSTTTAMWLAHNGDFKRVKTFVDASSRNVLYVD